MRQYFWIMIGVLITSMWGQPLSLASPIELHVSPEGRDDWSGQLAQPSESKDDGPLASLQGARDRIRHIKEKNNLTGPIRVLIQDGRYELTEPIVFSAADSGTGIMPISYEAAVGATPVFSGGRVITGWQRGDDGVWKTFIPQVKMDQWYFNQLFIDGRRATRARSPNKFYYYTKEKVGQSKDVITGEMVDMSKRAFIARPKDIEPLLAVPKALLNDVNIVAYHSWASSRNRLAHLDGETNRVITTGKVHWKFMHFKPHQRYHLENFAEALDVPGEWFLDRDGMLSYIPRPGEDIAKSTVVAPRVEQFVRFEGDAESNRWVENITLSGLTFEHGRYRLPPTGHADMQAAVDLEAVIMADGARHITIEDCSIGHVGLHGVWLRRSCHNNRIERCHLYDLGAGGVRIGESQLCDEPMTSNSDNTVNNNIIHHGGRMMMGAVGVWIGHSGYNRITHNDIGDFFYTGISVGWRWGYRDSHAHHNAIEYNHIHHLGQAALSDMGGVYTLGKSPGTTVSHNVVHDVYAYAYGGWGLYNDEGSSYITMENNLVYNVKSGCYHQHYGRENKIHNNIFAFSMNGQIVRSREEDHISFSFKNNIVYWRTGPLLTSTWKGGQFKMKNNIYHKTSGEPVTFAGDGLSTWQQRGHDLGSSIVDPRFVDPENYNFHLQSESPALDIGFKPFDYRRAGVYGDESWIELARSDEMPTLEWPPDPLPFE